MLPQQRCHRRGRPNQGRASNHSLSSPRELDPLPKSRRGALQIRRKHLLQSLRPSTSTHELLHKVFRQQHGHCYSAAAEPVPVPITSFLVTISMRPLEQEHCSLSYLHRVGLIALSTIIAGTSSVVYGGWAIRY
ncbi:hypothetical protein NL676_034459 [Syzygium grande]|nr:hypothetical protein NL676_034459 [Syzygium grande]